MAGDLIPPPSPAGRPDPDAGRSRESVAEAPERLGDNEGFLAPPSPPHEEVVAEPAEVQPAIEAPYRSRFGFITGALVGLGLAMAVVAVLVFTGRSGDDGPAWSAWKPRSTDKYVAAAEIADHVGRRYRLDDGSQLATVQAGPIQLDDLPLTVVVRTAPKGGDIEPIVGEGVWYVLNGLGERGSIATGEVSQKRGALVEREALELALYTFRYIPEFDHVVTVLPPPRPEAAGRSASATARSALSPDAPESGSRTPPRAILFRPGDLKRQLQAPLALTLPSTPPLPGAMSDQESELYQQFTADKIFDMSVVSSQIGQGFLVLDRPRTTTEAEELVKSAVGNGKG